MPKPVIAGPLLRIGQHLICLIGLLELRLGIRALVPVRMVFHCLAAVRLLDLIAGGALLGHVDSHRMVWIGHSRGGEGVVLAHRRLRAGNSNVEMFTADDVKLISSIAPTDFRGRRPQVPAYHLWTGGADSDVNGCANCDICQTFHFYERAEGKRMSASPSAPGRTSPSKRPT